MKLDSDGTHEAAGCVGTENGELAQLAETNALAKNFEVAAADLLQNFAVDLRHHFGRQHVLTVAGGEEALGFFVIVDGFLVLMLNQGLKAGGGLAFQQLLRGHMVAPQIRQGQVDAAIAGVFTHVANDVGELERIA